MVDRLGELPFTTLVASGLGFATKARYDVTIGMKRDVVGVAKELFDEGGFYHDQQIGRKGSPQPASSRRFSMPTFDPFPLRRRLRAAWPRPWLVEPTLESSERFGGVRYHPLAHEDSHRRRCPPDPPHRFPGIRAASSDGVGQARRGREAQSRAGPRGTEDQPEAELRR